MGRCPRRFGRLSRGDVLAPAIELAAAGFPAWDGFIHSVEATAPLVADGLGPDAPSSRSTGRMAGRGGRASWSGFPALAATLETPRPRRLRRLLRRRSGERAGARPGRGRLADAAADLRDHRSTWGEPISIDYRGVRVTTHPPNCSGIVALELLNILASSSAPPAARRSGRPAVTDPRWIHLGIEAAKLAMADRDAHLTDPEFHDIPVERLLDPTATPRCSRD